MLEYIHRSGSDFHQIGNYYQSLPESLRSSRIKGFHAFHPVGFPLVLGHFLPFMEINVRCKFTM